VELGGELFSRLLEPERYLRNPEGAYCVVVRPLPTKKPAMPCREWANVALVFSAIDMAREALIFFPQFAAFVAR
jgi:hypothetical protein